MALSSVYLVALCFLGLAVLAAASPYRQQRQMTRPGQDIPLPDWELLQRQIAQQNERYNRPLEQQPFSDNDGGDHQLARRNDYYCRLHPSHTLCQQPHSRETCGYVHRRRLSFDEAALVLHEHNLERMMVANGQRGDLPPGANIMQLSYNIELHDIAQGAADVCRDDHDCGDCRLTERFQHVGQNVATQTRRIRFSHRQFSRDDLRRIDFKPVTQMGGWLNEVKLMSPEDIHKFTGGRRFGHYTQLVWANTTLLGCGYLEREVPDGLSAALYCNYGRGGNFINEPIYRAGEACSACPRGSQCSQEYPGLCKEGSP